MDSDILKLRSEYAVLMSVNKEYDKIAEICETSYGSNAICISGIFKINNPTLTERFESQRREIQVKRGVAPEVIEVFHGTTLEAAQNIIGTGFDPMYSTIAAFGKGTYASPQMRMALHYCKDVSAGKTSMIFYCRMLKGIYGQPTAGAPIDTTRADYSGNGRDVYVTPYIGGIIPDYLVCYYSWDRRN